MMAWATTRTRERDIDREKLFESGQARATKGARALKRWFNTLHPDELKVLTPEDVARLEAGAATADNPPREGTEQ